MGAMGGFDWLVLAVFAVIFGISSAHAQVTPVMSFPATNVEVEIDGVKKATSDRLFIGKLQCEGSDGTGDDGSEIQIELFNLAGTAAANARVLEFWLGMGGQDCTVPTNRMAPYAGLRAPCIKLGDPVREIDTRRQIIHFRARDVFTSPDQSESVCDLQGAWVLYLVPLVNDTPPTGTPDAALGPPIWVRFEADFVPPEPVFGLVDVRGEETVDLAWSGTALDALTTFDVYLDPSAVQPANAGPCTSTLLRAGEPIPVSSEGLSRITTKTSSLSLNVLNLGVLEGEKIPATVVARDSSGNASVASEVVCVERLSSTSKGKSERGRDVSCFDGCAVQPARKEASLGLWALAIALLVSWRGYVRRSAARQ